MATAPDMVIEIAEAKQLQRGGLYVIEIPNMLSQAQLSNITEAMKPFAQTHGVDFMLLDSGMRLSEVRPAGVEEIAEAVVRKLRESGGLHELESSKKYDEGEDYIQQLALRAEGKK